MNDTPSFEKSPEYTAAKARWEADYNAQLGDEAPRLNRSGIKIKPVYGPDDWNSDRYMDDLGLPGESPTTRGIHSTMHRGRPWSPRLVVGLDLPEDYNTRMRALYDLGLMGLYVAPCNSHMRGFDPDEVEPELLGTCGTVIASAALEFPVDRRPTHAAGRRDTLRGHGADHQLGHSVRQRHDRARPRGG